MIAFAATVVIQYLEVHYIKIGYMEIPYNYEIGTSYDIPKIVCLYACTPPNYINGILDILLLTRFIIDGLAHEPIYICMNSI